MYDGIVFDMFGSNNVDAAIRLQTLSHFQEILIGEDIELHLGMETLKSTLYLDSDVDFLIWELEYDLSVGSEFREG